MQIHNFEQGSPEWHAHRFTHDNASEAAAMLGLSKTTTRTELLRMRKTGSAKEFSAWVQRNVLDKGHAVEALARPLVEDMLCKELYPVTVSEGRLSASLDGLTMDEILAFECKQWSAEIAAQVTAGIMPEQHMPQVQQILMISKKTKKLVFTVTDGTPENLLTLDVYPDTAWFERIRAGWAQFALDLAAYEPAAPAPVIVATVMESLPAVMVQTKGELSIVSNLPEFATALHAFIAKIPAAPTTDREFADTENACKALKKAEDALEAAESNALAMGTVEEMRRMVADLRNLARVTRLSSEKLVARQKDILRLEIIKRGTTALAEHIAGLNAKLGRAYMPPITADFAAAIKGKRTVDSLNDAVDTLLANTKITADAAADRIAGSLGILRELAAERTELFADTSQLVLKAPDDLTAIIKSRITEADKKEADRLEALREKIRKEEQTKLADKAAAKLAADAAMAKAAAPVPAPVEPAPAPSPAPASAPAPAPSPASAPAPAAFAAVRQAFPAPAEPASSEATLSLGEIGGRMGIPLSASFLRGLGFEPVGTRRAAVLFQEADFDAMCIAFEAHIRNVRQAHRANA